MREILFRRVVGDVDPDWTLVGASRFQDGRVTLLVKREPELRDDAPSGEDAIGGGE